MTARQVMGLTFRNPLGVAAGLDRDGHLGRGVGALGFGAIEIGTLTPRPEPGHNPGIDSLEQRRTDSLERRTDNLKPCPGRPPVRLGINIGPNSDTPPDRALDDYRQGLRGAWPHADYIALNFSGSPGAALLHPQRRPQLLALLAALMGERERLRRRSGRRVPLALKLRLDPTLPAGLPPALLHALRRSGIDALIAVTDTPTWSGPMAPPVWWEVSSRQRACALIRRLASRLNGRLAIIAVGGIRSNRDATARLRAGADLVQQHRALLPRIGTGRDGPTAGRLCRSGWRAAST